MKRFVYLVVAVTFASLLWCGPARAISTSHWTQQNEADFKAGTMHNVVVTNLGDVKLSRALQTIQDQDPEVTEVNALAEGPDGAIYAGTGPKGLLLVVRNDKVDTLASLDAVNVLSLLVDDHGAVWIGTGGDKGRVLRIDKPGEAPKEIFSAPDVQYVWALAQTPDGNVYAATGPNGQVFQIKGDGSHSELYKSSEDNITSMLSDGKDFLYLGTDPDGMVIRLNRKTGDAFILYNASESEITALAMDSRGNLYAATGEAGDRQQQQQQQQNKEEQGGRPESSGGGAPIPPNPPDKPPKAPPLPTPGPNEPKPIPKSPQSQPSQSLAQPFQSQPVFMDQQPGQDPGDGGNGPNGGNGPDQGDNSANGQNATSPGGRPPAVTPPQQPGEQRPEGNAIYKIDTDGFVTEIFRENAVIYSMIEQNNVLLVGTGDDGNIYQVDPAAGETVVLAKADAKQVMSLMPARDGRIIVGLANAGGISALTSGYADDGDYISPVLDATQVSRFGNIQLHGLLPDGTSLKVSTRSGNVKDADTPGWSKWTDEVNAAQFVPVKAPPARFLQYRMHFSTSNPAKTPLVDHVDVTYQIPNLPPVIKSVKIGVAAQPDNGGDNSNAPPNPRPENAKTGQGTATQTVTWDASDPNNDTLIYSLYFRLEPEGPWILMKDKLKDTSFDWDTRTVADGSYQIKVIASDAPSNPPAMAKTTSRVSDYFIVSNTPPLVGDLESHVTGADATISLRAQVHIGIVANVEYALDSSDQWQVVLPVNGIFDSPDERVRFTIKGLTPGQHQVTIRATDSHGNQALQTVMLNIQGPATGEDSGH